MKRLLYLVILLLLLAGAAAYFLVVWPVRNPHPALRHVTGVLAIRGAKIYTSPEAPPIESGNVIAKDGIIAAAGPDAPIPADAQILSCNGCVVTAGFWNAHVHFTEPKWSFAAWKSRAALDAQLADMLTSRGFTTVVDTGSDPRGTLSLRRRIESGDLRGPAIYTAGSAIYPPNGVPIYVKNAVPRYILWLLPQPATPQAAAADAERNIAVGADLLKLFTGSWVARGKVLPMPVPIATAAVQVAHRHGQLVFSHPSSLAGMRVALESGVDVLAHAADSPEGVDAAFLRQIVDHRMAMVPTLKMFATTVTTNPDYLNPIYEEVREFHSLGGQILFGTDVGYMTDYRTEDEFRALARSGLGPLDILRALTTAPAQRFGVTSLKGAIEPGKSADLVVLDADPLQDVTALARVRWTIRNGEVIYARP